VWPAFFALACQFGLSLGHIHVGSFSVSAAVQSRGRTTCAAILPHAPAVPAKARFIRTEREQQEREAAGAKGEGAGKLLRVA
jgi:hypothetical protein